MQEELGRVRAERDELALRFAEAEGLAAAISAELSPPDSEADEAISPAQGTSHVAAACGHAAESLCPRRQLRQLQYPDAAGNFTGPLVVPGYGSVHVDQVPSALIFTTASAAPRASHLRPAPVHVDVCKQMTGPLRISHNFAGLFCPSRRCLALTPPLPDTESRGRRRVQQLYSAGRADTPPQLHEHAAAVQQAFAALQVHDFTTAGVQTF